MSNTDISMVILNNSTQKSSTEMYVYQNDDNGNSIDSFMQTVDSVSSVIKGFVRLSNKGDSGQFLLFQITDISKNTDDYWTIDITNQAFSEDSPFQADEDVLVSFVTNGNKGDQGYQGHQGYTGYQGFQGNTISWWNSYTSTFNNQTTAPPGDKTFRRGTNPTYQINSTNYSDINLETLVSKGVVRKEADTPENGYTTYTLLRNIEIDTGTSTTDILDTNYLQLLEGYIFNGNGFTITVNNSGNNQNNSQGGIFVVPQYSVNETNPLPYNRKVTTIKNLKIAGDATISYGNAALISKKNRTTTTATNIKVENIFVTRTRDTSSGNGGAGIFPHGFPGDRGSLHGRYIYFKRSYDLNTPLGIAESNWC